MQPIKFLMKRKKIKRKQIFLFISYFLISFFIIDFVLSKYRSFYMPHLKRLYSNIHKKQIIEAKSLGNHSQHKSSSYVIKHVKIPRMPSICNSISDVTASDDIITVHYSGKIPTTNETLLISHFSLLTKWMEQTIFFPLGTAEPIKVSKKSFSLRFFLPVVASYPKSTLYCSAPPYNISRLREEVMKFVLSEHSVDLVVPGKGFGEELTKDDALPSSYSRFKCHNLEHYEIRWCEYRNLAYFDDYFFFLSPATFTFPEPFLVPGPRAPPFDIVSDRFVIEPVVLPFNTTSIPRSLELVTDYSFIYGVFHNFFMLWHVLFDFAMPLYNFMHNILPKNYSIVTEREARRVYVKSDGVWIFESLVKLFSYKPITIVKGSRKNYLFTKGTLGIEKPELNPVSKHYEDNLVNFKYNFNRQTGLGYREKALVQLGIDPKERGFVEIGNSSSNHKNITKPLALFIDRGSGVRNIQNTPEVFDVMVKGCGDFCKALRVKFHNMGVEEQVKLVSRASVLVGLHGSGLAHVLFMPESTKKDPSFLVEFLPYKYTCRDWYHVAANVAGVTYLSVMNRKMPSTPLRAGGSNENEQCYNDPKMCPTLHCHDLLRDQKTSIEVDTFNQTWNEIMKQLKDAYGDKFAQE